ncbi:hypothetical protein HPP92_020100 [Vanilla planifolia]|uniref:Uncharacterized protein n=1 Tax=Vanilla planifolia TaxID=51239 RepID=A0A835Q447_VANPL|nr:hypothetical protein HPP92_020100 [Vanilla planifolia]
MEENEDNNTLLCNPDIEAAEKPFYELIGQNYPPSSDPSFICPILTTEHSDDNSSQNPTCSRIYSFCSNSIDAECQNLFSPQSYLPPFSGNVGFDELGFRDYQFSEMLVRTLPASLLQKGAEEAMKFLPSEDKVVLSVGEFGLALPREPVAKFVDNNKRQKNRTVRDSILEEQRRRKQRTISYDKLAVTEEMFDVLLLSACDDLSAVVNSIREKMDRIEKKNYKIAEQREIGGSQNSRYKKQPTEATVNLHTLLLHCSQSVANGETRRAYEQLRQIRKHSSDQGDACQRVAHYVAKGLEARLSGTGNEACNSVPRWKTVADVLKAYELHLGYCPFKKITYHFANQIILDAIQDAQSVHILDFGICYGLQWPIFIKKLGLRPGRPPFLRITGIDFPQPGLRPSERIEETGRLLAHYAERFCLSFEYHVIAAKFDELKEEQLHLHENETLVVNSMFCLHNLADETVAVDCPRNMVLQLIRKLKPSVFVNAIVNGTYGAPFFVTRFREALYHFSAMFDMLDSTTSRENERRLLVERDLYGNFLDQCYLL